MTVGEKRASRRKLYVYADSKAYDAEAERLAEKLQAELISDMEAAKQGELVLFLGKDGLSLKCDGLSLREDFSEMLSRVKNEKWQHELLVRASKLKNAEGRLTAIDATAGLGEDSLLLAAAGYDVLLYELNPVIVALLKDALMRAGKIPELADMVSRMRLLEADSIEAMSQMKTSVDLIYLDPMFPARQKTGLIKKKFQLLQKLESPCMEEEELLKAAMSVCPRRIVIKRPAKGPYINDVKPDFSFQGKSIRYDCFQHF